MTDEELSICDKVSMGKIIEQCKRIEKPLTLHTDGDCCLDFYPKLSNFYVVCWRNLWHKDNHEWRLGRK